MRKSIWIEWVEWGVLALVILFLAGVMWMRDEIISSTQEGSNVPGATFGD